jgi:hypothetical protein
MHFDGEEPSNLDCHRNPSVIRRALKRPSSRRESRRVIRTIWPNQPTNFVAVDCGRWSGMNVFIDFAIIRHDRGMR